MKKYADTWHIEEDYSEMRMREKISKMMEASPKKYIDNTFTYVELQENYQAAPYLNRKCQKIWKWLNFIFERFGDNKIPEKIDWLVLDGYSKTDYNEIKSIIEDDIVRLARLFAYIDYVFLDDREKYRDDYKRIYQLLEKTSSDQNWDFFERHEEIERIYNDIWDKTSRDWAEKEIRQELYMDDISDREIQELVEKEKPRIRSGLDKYFTYERAVALLSDEFTDIKLSRERDFALGEYLQKLKSFFSNTIDLYKGLYTRTVDYDDELTTPEAALLEIIFDLIESDSVKNESDLAKGRWEVIGLEEREEIISYIDEMYECGEDVVNKYIGAVTSQDLIIQMERIKYKLRNPLLYRILIKLEEIGIEIHELKNLQDEISDDTKYEGSESLIKIEKELDKVLRLITEQNNLICKSVDKMSLIISDIYK